MKKLLNSIGWTFLGFSILMSFTFLPLATIIAFFEPVSSGDSGGQWFYILILCLITGLAGFAVLYRNKKRQHVETSTFTRRYFKLVCFQAAAVIITAIIAPYKEDPRNSSFDPVKKLIDKKNESKTHIGPYEGTFVLYNSSSIEYNTVNSELAKTRLSPCSTFKVPHTVFGLEHGYITGKDFSQKYDRNKNPQKEWWPEEWSKDQNLESAIQNSVVWFYQEVARNIGKEKMSEYLERLDYGNKDIGSEIDKFWLSASLKISPLEQVKTWSRLFSNHPNFDKKHIKIVKDIIILEKRQDYTLRGKTGTCSYPNGNYGAWLVGSLTKKYDTYYFATYLKSNDFKQVTSDRLPLTKKMLAQFGAISTDHKSLSYSFEPEIQCTIVEIKNNSKILGIKVNQFDSVSNDAVQSKLTIAGQPLNTKPRQIKKNQDFEEIEISQINQKVVLKIHGEPISRNGTLELNGEQIAKITCH